MKLFFKKISVLALALSFIPISFSCQDNRIGVQFNTREGSFIPGQAINKGQTVNKPDDPTKEGYTFFNWYDNIAFNGEPFNFATPIYSNLILYARWAHKVNFRNDDGSLYLTQIVPESTLVNKPNNPSKDLFVFDDWYKEPELINKFDFENTIITENIELYAHFNPSKYKITYHNVEGLQNDNPTEYSYTIGVDKLLPVSKDKYRFKGWFRSPTFEPDSKIESISKQMHEDIDLYASLDNHYSISYPNWPEEIRNDNKTIYTSDESVLLDGSVFTETEYLDLNFSRFYEIVDGEKVTVTGWSAGVAEDKNIYVDINPSSRTINLNTNEGKIRSYDYIYLDYNYDGKGIEKIDNMPFSDDTGASGFNPNGENVPFREGYVFRGWCFDKECQNLLLDDVDNVVPSGATLYAKWDKIPDGYCSLEENDGIFEAINPGEPVWSRLHYNLLIPSQYSEISIYFIASVTDKPYIYSLFHNIYADDVLFYDGKIEESLYAQSITNHQAEVKNIENKNALICNTDLNVYGGGGGGSWTHKYHLEIKPTKYKCQSVKINPSQVVLNTYFWNRLSINDPQSESLSFVGWYDENDNKFSSGDIVKYLEPEITLNARWE